MKTVHDKDGNKIEVADDKPCHAGIDGALPVMLDATLDAKIFTEMAARKAAHDAKAPERAAAKIIDARNKERGSLEKQWEYFIDNGYTKLRELDDQIKLNHPKGE